MSDDTRQNENASGEEDKQKDYDKMVQDVTTRVMELMREELRLTQERRGKSGRR